MNEKQITCLHNCNTEQECIFCDETHKKDIQNCPCGKNCEGFKINSFFIFYHFISAGCPCEDFDCSLLDDFAESCKDPGNNENYQKFPINCLLKEKVLVVDLLTYMSLTIFRNPINMEVTRLRSEPKS